MNQEDLLELVIAPRVIQPETLEEVEEQFLFLDGCGEMLHPGVVLKIRDEDGSMKIRDEDGSLLLAPGRASPGDPHSRNIP